MKKTICLALIICLCMGSVLAFGSELSDLDRNSRYYEAVVALTKDGIFTGYEDGSFKPEGYITRGEVAAIVCRFMKLDTDKFVHSTFDDVKNDYWACQYIMAAVEEGVLNGYGDGCFGPDDCVTGHQIIKIVVSMAGCEDLAVLEGGWPRGYSKVALKKGIIDEGEYRRLAVSGGAPAVRGEVALYIHNANRAIEKSSLMIGDKVYTTGMSAHRLENPDEVLPSVFGWEYYVYGTETYENFFVAEVLDGKVIGLSATGPGFEYCGIRAGDTVDETPSEIEALLLDSNDGNRVHGVRITHGTSEALGDYIAQKNLRGEAKANYHYTNGFRTFHGLDAFKWSEEAAMSAELHSKDMATNGYVSHTSLDGRKMTDRMEARGIRWSSAAENIFAGLPLAIHAHDGWVNSAGHRKNLLSKCIYMGVGVAYSPESEYRVYYTQNLFSR